MREKENFGKKPVRRSKPDENDSAKVYRPRTASVNKPEPKEKPERSNSDSEEQPSERRKLSTPKREDSRDQKRPARSGGDNSPLYKPRTLKTKSADSFREERQKRFESDSAPEKSNSFDDDKRVERESRPSKPRSFEKDKDRESRPSRSRSNEGDRGRDFKRGSRFDADKPRRFSKDRDNSNDRDSSTTENKPKSFYEEKFSKPIPRKFPKVEEKRNTKPIEDRLKKRPKTFETAPEIENELKTDKDGNIRLNKYIANSGLCSRREADEYIQKGLITINGVVVTELGTKVKLTDEINFKGKQLDPEKKVYILLNKPKDYVTTVEDPNATHTVMELISGACEQRVYPVGRLDRNSTGLLLFTNDGELTKRLTHPSFMKKKIYEVGLDKPVKLEDMASIRNGVEIEGEIVSADAIEHIDEGDRSLIGIEIHSGQNRIVRRIFEKLGYKVYKLDRVYFAGLTKKNLPRGKWRFLTQKEVNMLKMNRYE
jgi:23S rRNA pseudouridine2605 synthase